MAAVTAVTNTINQIKNTLSAGAGVQAAAQNMGSKITTGFKLGAKNLGSASVTVVSAAINAVKNRYATMQSAGNALGAALLRGFRVGSGMHSPMAAVVASLNDTLNYIRGLTSSFYSAGSDLGSRLAKGYTDEEKASMSAVDLMNANRSSVMDIYYGSGISLRGGSAGSPFEEGGISSGSPTENNNTVNIYSLVTERTVVNEIKNLLNKDSDLDAMRS